MTIQIKPFQAREHIDRVLSLWYTLLPGYNVAEHRLRKLLDNDSGSHYVAYAQRKDDASQTEMDQGGDSQQLIVGFTATYVDITTFTREERKGFISVVLVDSAYQNEGVGTELLKVASAMLLRTYVCNTICVGSVFPRFWPGVPTDIPQKAQDFFRHFFNGKDWLRMSEDTLCRDLYIDLPHYTSASSIVEKAARAGVTFSPLSSDGFAECMRRQRENFQNDGWVAAYEELGRRGLHRQIMVAYNPDGAQIGWTLMIEPNLPVWDKLAFPSLVGEKTGLIACVGVDKHARKMGIGLALVDHAVLDLKERGMRHAFVDWVVLEGWYEKLGFRTWREYRTLVWKPRE